MEDFKFSSGDIIVRQYKSGREAICLYIEFDSHKHILYIGESFNYDGGLTFLEVYGFCDDCYKYRLSTHKEVSNVLLTLKEYYSSGINYNIWKIGDIRMVIDMVSKYKSTLRIEKLMRLEVYKNEEV